MHKILEDWHKLGAQHGELIPIAERKLDEMSAHPFMRGLWRPRLLAALRWIEDEQHDLEAQGRKVVAAEKKGEMRVDGIRIHGRADRIDTLPDGSLAVVDYKTGSPPSGKMVQEGYALQLGLIGLIAREGGFEGVRGEPSAFEYWSLSRKPKSRDFGWRSEPVMEGKKTSGIPREDFLPETERYLREAIARWILGNEPFTARLNPDLPGYADYDQLMRLDEWQGRDAREDRS